MIWDRRLGLLRARLLARKATIGRGVYIGPQCQVTVTGGLTLGDGVRVERGTRIDARGRITIGPHTKLMSGCLLECDTDGELEIGRGCWVSQGCVLTAGELTRIGDRCQLAEYVSVRDRDHVIGDPSSPQRVSAPVIVEDDVWLAAKSTVTRGVRVGARAVIGAGAVVTRDIPATAVAVGVPARPR